MKVFSGALELEPLGGICQLSLDHGNPRIINSIDGQKEASGKKFLSVKQEPDNEWNSMDSTINRAHQHSAGARKGEDVAMGRSKGGLTTKVHMLSDAHGNPQDFVLTEGQAHDMREAHTLLEKSEGEFLLCDKGYDSQELRDAALSRGVTPVIPRRENSQKPNEHFDSELYKARHTIENLFAKMKQFRSFSTRYDKLKRNYAAVVSIVCAIIWLKLLVN